MKLFERGLGLQRTLGDVFENLIPYDVATDEVLEGTRVLSIKVDGCFNGRSVWIVELQRPGDISRDSNVTIIYEGPVMLRTIHA